MNWQTKLYACIVVAVGPSLVLGQPLVTGNLSLYYDFEEIVTVTVDDEEEKRFLDQSGNGLYGTIHEGDPEEEDEPGTLTLDTAARRGAGAARLTQSTEGGAPVYVDLHGDIISDEHPELLPAGGLNEKFGLSVAAWVNVTANDIGDQSILQGRSSDGGHGNPHFQLQGNGKLRMTFRDQTGTNVVNAPQVYIDGTEDSEEKYPVDEWFHYAGTYDADANVWAMYYNGAKIQGGEGTGDDLGDWGGLEGDLFGLGFGAVYDSGGRRFDGLMDELYIFNRALTADEVMTLYNVPDEAVAGDCDSDGSLAAADLACVTTIADRDLVLGAIGALPGDLDGNGAVEFADFLVLSGNFGKSDQNYTQGNIDLEGEVAFADFLVLSGNFGNTAGGVASVPEPASFGLLVAAMIALGLCRGRRA